jgi:succinate dehydrogenase / fumarate reductase flavoprotein subunit
MMSLVLDDHQVCRGLVAMELRSLELKAFAADAVIIATGGPGLIYGKSTNSMVCTGSAVAVCYQQERSMRTANSSRSTRLQFRVKTNYG